MSLNKTVLKFAASCWDIFVFSVGVHAPPGHVSYLTEDVILWKKKTKTVSSFFYMNIIAYYNREIPGNCP